LALLTITTCARQADILQDLLDCSDAFYTAIEEVDTLTRIDLLAEDILLLPNHWTIMPGVAQNKKCSHLAAKFLKSMEARR